MTFREELYEKRTFVPCWSASPVRRLVLKTLDDKDAIALVQELAHGGHERDWDAESEFVQVQHEAAMRRLREWRDSLGDDLP